MPRTKKRGQIPITKYDIFFGFDEDVKKWFIDISLSGFYLSQNIQWFDNNDIYDKHKKKFMEKNK